MMTHFPENSDIDEIEVVPLCAEHLFDVSKIEIECFSEPWSEKSLSLLLDKNNFGIVALHNGQVVGYAGMTTVLDEGSVTNIAVSFDYRRKGIGRMIVESLLNEAKRRGISIVFLEVRESNEAAKGLYRSFGFAECGIRKGFYKNPFENAIQMLKNID